MSYPDDTDLGIEELPSKAIPQTLKRDRTDLGVAHYPLEAVPQGVKREHIVKKFREGFSQIPNTNIAYNVSLYTGGPVVRIDFVTNMDLERFPEVTKEFFDKIMNSEGVSSVGRGVPNEPKRYSFQVNVVPAYTNEFVEQLVVDLMKGYDKLSSGSFAVDVPIENLHANEQ